MISESTVKNNIRIIRERMGLSQCKMGEAIGISVTAYRKFEVEDTAVISRNLYALAEYAHMTPEEIILGYEPADTSDPSWHSEVDMNEAIASLRSFYETKLKEKSDELAEKDVLIAELRKDLKKVEAFSASQQSVIDFLQKHTNL